MIVRKGQLYQYMDYTNLGTTPSIKQGNVVEIIKRESLDMVKAKHKRKIVSFHITNITYGYFMKVKKKRCNK